jgi:hypothetical protein
MRNAGRVVTGSFIITIARAMYRELPWKTGVRMRVLKYMTGEMPHNC